MTKVSQVHISRHSFRNERFLLGVLLSLFVTCGSWGFGPSHDLSQAGRISEGFLIVAATAQSCLQFVSLPVSWQDNELLLMCVLAAAQPGQLLPEPEEMLMERCCPDTGTLRLTQQGFFASGHSELGLFSSFLPSLEPLKVNPGTFRSH